MALARYLVGGVALVSPTFPKALPPLPGLFLALSLQAQQTALETEVLGLTWMLHESAVLTAAPGGWGPGSS